MTNATNAGASNPKTFNIFKVLTLLRTQNGATVSDISQNTAIPMATVYRIIHVLQEEGIILQTEKIASPSGRQPTLYSINPTYASAICIIIEKTLVTVCLTDMIGCIISMATFDLEHGCGKDAVLEAVDDKINALLDSQWGEDKIQEKIKAIYVTVEADVDIAEGRVVRFSGASCFDGFEVVSYFESRYGVPTSLDKLLYVEAIYSIKRYYRYKFDHYIFLHIGVGFGATIVIDGKIYAGAHCKAGELVRLKSPDGRSWEEAYRTSLLYQDLIRIAGNDPGSELNVIFMNSFTSPRSGNARSLMAVLDKALEIGCAEAIALVSEAAAGWSSVIRLLYEFFDPEVIVIGGDISSQTPNVFNLIRNSLWENEGFDGVVLPAEYETSLTNAVALGALDMLYDNIYKGLEQLL